MSGGVELWDRFVVEGQRDAARIAGGIAALAGDATVSDEGMAELASLSFRLATQALLLGAADIGELAIACERALDLLAARKLPDGAISLLASSTDTLRSAFDTLANPDASGARTDGLPLEAACDQLEALFAGKVVVAASTPARAPSPRREESETRPGAAVWEPNVDEDMLELFFEEANERIEDLSVKLLDIEQRPDDVELLRDIFRDLHTIKGSSAMVALVPMNKLAHAAEDLVGELRDGTRTADAAVVDTLLAALDGLRKIVELAQNREPLTFDSEPIAARLRDPSAVVAAPAGDEAAAASCEAAAASPKAKRSKARETIRVDFDKLDRLLNLVGELLLGRDGLRGASQSLSSVSSELSSDRQATRRVSASRAVGAGLAPSAPSSVRRTLTDLGDESPAVTATV